MATEAEILAAFDFLAAGFTNFSPTRAILQACVEDLREIPGGLVFAAAVELRQCGREFFPPSGVWRQRALDLWSQEEEEQQSQRILRLPDPRNLEGTLEGRQRVKQLVDGFLQRHRVPSVGAEPR